MDGRKGGREEGKGGWKTDEVLSWNEEGMGVVYVENGSR